METHDALPSSTAPFLPSSQLSLTGLRSLISDSTLRFWDVFRTALLFNNNNHYFVDFNGTGIASRGPFVLLLLTILLTIMVACGIFSPLFRRRSRKEPLQMGRYRRAARAFINNSKGHSDVPSGTVTSSEDEYYENEGSEEETEKELSRRRLRREEPTEDEALGTDPGLLRKHSSYVSYTTSVATYPSVRTFYCPHPHMSKLPLTPAPIPLLVFVHGLGGSLAQFQHVLTSLCNLGPCFGIDLPGCGLSAFEPKSWDAYRVEALTELLTTAIEKYRDKEAGQGVILVAHSLGCSISALVASSTSPVKVENDLRKHILGLIAVCPRASPPSAQEVTLYRRLLRVPGFIFDAWRCWDRRGGPQSASVTRFVGPDADPYTRELQVRFNKQSKTPVWRRMAWGTLPVYDDDGKAIGGLPGETIWGGVRTAILLVAGESDAITRPTEIKKLLEFFGEIKPEPGMKLDTDDGSIIPDASNVCDRVLADGIDTKITTAATVKANTSQQPGTMTTMKSFEKPHADQGRGRIVKTAILPCPASHALLFDRATYHTLSGIMQDFLSQQIDSRLNLGWQLQYLNTSGKWDVKNLVKWKKVVPVSQPIGGTFAALKVLREVDDTHNPAVFSRNYRGIIHAVVDISHENPVYDPAELERNGIRYYKHPTVSKLPPTQDETRDFIALVDRIENDITKQIVKQKEGKQHSDNDSGTTTDTSTSTSTSTGSNTQQRPLVGVHCHYGYNRTGFLIACYLIEREGFSVHDALDEFERCRPPGIRHRHFIDTLFVRYCVGLKGPVM